MGKQKCGFTLVELLAVITILSLIILIASSSVTTIMNKAKEKTAQEMRDSLGDAAIIYVIDNFHLQKCSSINNIESLINTGCAKKVTVENLKSNNLFEDDQNHCANSDYAIIYRYNDDYQAYIPNTACEK